MPPPSIPSIDDDDDDGDDDDWGLRAQPTRSVIRAYFQRFHSTNFLRLSRSVNNYSLLSIFIC